MSMGLLQSAQALLATALGIARTRLDLVSVELQELLARLVLVMIGAVAAIMLGTVAIAFGAVALVLAVAPEHRVWVSAGLAAAFFALAAFIAWQAWRGAQALPFAASLAELERDVEALKGARQ